MFVLGIAEDFTSNVVFDDQLLEIPGSSLYLNSGAHPSITIENLLSFLPKLNVTISVWAVGDTYGLYKRNRADLVEFNGVIYQSLQAGNTGNQPDLMPLFWLPTNQESLRLKHLLNTVEDRVYSDLNLTRRLINNQYLYEVAQDNPQEIALPNDFAGWVFEPKGSDYISFRINQVSFQQNSVVPVNLYVINQGVLIDTLQITPANGVVSFEELNYTFSGFGRWIFAIDSQTVITNGGTIDPLKYDGFVVHTAVGIGATPEGSDYSFNSSGNGLGFNISAFLDSQVYIDNNVNDFGNFIRATFEYIVFQMFLHNSNNVSNRQQRIQMNDDLLELETKNINGDTVARRYMIEKKKAVKQLQKTFDTQLDNNDFEIEFSTI